MELETLDKVKASVINESEETDFSFLNIDISEDLASLNAQNSRTLISTVGKNFTNCIYDFNDILIPQISSFRLDFLRCNLSNVTIKIPIPAERIFLREITVDTLNIVLTHKGHVDQIMLYNVKAKELNIIIEESTTTYNYQSKKTTSIILDEDSRIDILNYQGSSPDVNKQSQLSFYARSYSELTINTLRLSNVILKDGDNNYYDSEEESPEFMIYNLELNNVTLLQYLNTTLINLKLNLLNSDNFNNYLDDTTRTNTFSSLLEYMRYMSVLFKPSLCIQIPTTPETSVVDSSKVYGVIKTDSCRWARLEFKSQLSNALNNLGICESIRNEIVSTGVGISSRERADNFIITKDTVDKINIFIRDLCKMPGENAVENNTSIPVISLDDNGDVAVLGKRQDMNKYLTTYSYKNLIRYKQELQQTMNAQAYATLRASSPRPADSENLRGPGFDPEDIVSRAGSSQFALNPSLLDTISRQIESSNLRMPSIRNNQPRIDPLFISREESIFENEGRTNGMRRGMNPYILSVRDTEDAIEHNQRVMMEQFSRIEAENAAAAFEANLRFDRELAASMSQAPLQTEPSTYFEELNRRYLVESESTTRDIPHIDIFSNSNNN